MTTLMFNAQRIWRRYIQLTYWTFRCMRLAVCQRFYIVREAPDWFVAYYSNLYFRSITYGLWSDCGPATAYLLKQSSQEWKLRRRKLSS